MSSPATIGTSLHKGGEGSLVALNRADSLLLSAFSEIGEYFGGRSHSTAIAAERKVAQWLETDHGISLAHSVYPTKEVIRRIESNLRIG